MLIKSLWFPFYLWKVSSQSGHLMPWRYLSLWSFRPSFGANYSMVIPKTCVLIIGGMLPVIKTPCMALAGYCVLYFKHIFSSFLSLKSSSYFSFCDYLRSINSISCTLSSVWCVHFTFLKAEIPQLVIFMIDSHSLQLNFFVYFVCSYDKVVPVKYKFLPNKHPNLCSRTWLKYIM